MQVKEELLGVTHIVSPVDVAPPGNSALLINRQQIDARQDMYNRIAEAKEQISTIIGVPPQTRNCGLPKRLREA